MCYIFNFVDGLGLFLGYCCYGNDGYGEDEVIGNNYVEGGNNILG